MTLPDVGEITRWGFRWGPAEISRSCTLTRSNGDYRVLTIATEAHKTLHVYISPTGRLRVFDDSNGEWKPTA
jgi:hypothetical protein